MASRIREQAFEIERLRTLLRELAEEVIYSVSSCDSVVSIGAESLARVVIEEELAPHTQGDAP
jgi:hypothetical protein